MVKERLEGELKTISERKYCRYYLSAYEIAKECKRLHAPHLSRGCAGASLTAFLLNVTHTNPLPAHFYCPRCGYTDFDCNSYFLDMGKSNDDTYRCGFDLVSVYQRKVNCPKCGEELIGDGHDLPFETFSGINGDKRPQFDIDVPEELKESMQGFLNDLINNDDLMSADRDEQYEKSVKSLRIIGSRFLSLLNKLQELTDVSEEAIPIDGIAYSEFFGENNHADIPFIGNMPPVVSCFSDIVKMRGLGTGSVAWEAGGEHLVIYPLDDKQPIAHREDIMQKLMRHGFEKEKAFRIMETVRRGKARQLSDEDIREMKDKGIPYEYIDSMMKILYLFPRSHNTEFTIRIFKLMWYKQYFPEEFDRALKEYNSADPEKGSAAQ